MARDRDYVQLIHTIRWLHLRKATLGAHPLCQECEKEGRVEAATEVHHIIPVEDAVNYADKVWLMYDPHNLLALCHDCHVRIHTELGRCGREANKKRNEQQVAQVVRKFFDGNFGLHGG